MLLWFLYITQISAKLTLGLALLVLITFLLWIIFFTKKTGAKHMNRFLNSYARGEIDQQDFKELKRDLEEFKKRRNRTDGPKLKME